MPTPAAPAPRHKRAGLSPRELQILDLMNRPPGGQKHAAMVLGISVNTVESHLRSIYRKLGVTSHGQAWRIVNGRRR